MLKAPTIAGLVALVGSFGGGISWVAGRASASDVVAVRVQIAESIRAHADLRNEVDAERHVIGERFKYIQDRLDKLFEELSKRRDR